MRLYFRKGQVSWRAKSFRSKQAQVKAELLCRTDGDPKSIVQLAMENAQKLDDAVTDDDKMRRFVYVMSVLVNNVKARCLSESQIRGVSRMAWGILQDCGILPERTKLGFIVADLHLAISQNYWAIGSHKNSAWEQMLSRRLSQSHTEDREYLNDLAAGIRYLRLGHGSAAGKFFTSAANETQHRHTYEKAKIMQIKAHRLGGRLEDAESLADDLIKETLSETARLETDWERRLIEFTRSKNIIPLIRAVDARSSHYGRVFLLDTFFRAYTVPSVEYISMLPKMRYLAKQSGLQMRKAAVALKAAQKLEMIYDPDIPHTVRLNLVGQILPSIPSASSIEMELSINAALARWAYRRHSPAQAQFFALEYASMSRRLSDGLTDDSLGIMRDMLDAIDGIEWRGDEADGFSNSHPVPMTDSEAPTNEPSTEGDPEEISAESDGDAPLESEAPTNEPSTEGDPEEISAESDGDAPLESETTTEGTPEISLVG